MLSLLRAILILVTARATLATLDHGNPLLKRQGPIGPGVVNADVCATVQLRVPVAVFACTSNLSGLPVTVATGIVPPGVTCAATGATQDVNIGAAICLCLNAGVLTPDSLAAVLAQLTLTTNLATITRLTVTGQNGNIPFTPDSLLAALVANAQAQLGAVPDNGCDYPSGAIPNSCTGCGYQCPAGQGTCGDACIPLTDACPSGFLRKRSLQFRDSRCFGGLTACAIPSSALFSGKNYECIDTASDLESCGACAFPLPGQPIGLDCTAISKSANVACVSGTCVVKSCVAGFEPNAEGTGCIAKRAATLAKQKKELGSLLSKWQVRSEDLRTAPRKG